MPFLEVLAFEPADGVRAKAALAMTVSMAEVYEVSPEIISTYFVPIPSDGYAHAGNPELSIKNRRIFLKVHAFRRPREKRLAVAQGLTAALSEAFGVKPELVAVYFFDRDPGDVAHAGKLADG